MFPSAKRQVWPLTLLLATSPCAASTNVGFICRQSTSSFCSFLSLSLFFLTPGCFQYIAQDPSFLLVLPGSIFSPPPAPGGSPSHCRPPAWPYSVCHESSQTPTLFEPSSSLLCPPLHFTTFYLLLGFLLFRLSIHHPIHLPIHPGTYASPCLSRHPAFTVHRSCSRLYAHHRSRNGEQKEAWTQPLIKLVGQ